MEGRRGAAFRGLRLQKTPVATETSLSASADIVWLRDDFRLDDQPSIAAAAPRPALFVYVHDNARGGARPVGGAAKWRLAQSLASMDAELSARGARLDIVAGDAEQIDPSVGRSRERRPSPVDSTL